MKNCDNKNCDDYSNIGRKNCMEFTELGMATCNDYMSSEEDLIKKINDIPDPIQDEDELKTYLIDKWASDYMNAFLLKSKKYDLEYLNENETIAKRSYNLADAMWNARQESLK